MPIRSVVSLRQPLAVTVDCSSVKLENTVLRNLLDLACDCGCRRKLLRRLILGQTRLSASADSPQRQTADQLA
jgi:hypothetical protein